MQKEPFHGVLSWGVCHGASDFNVWIIPYNRGCHWSLIVVIFSEKTILHLCSLHLDLSDDVLDRLCWYIEKARQKITAAINWKEWKIYAPADIPQQNDGTNCGVHMCTWLYLIVERVKYQFDNEDMKDIRRWIFQEIDSCRNRDINCRRKKTGDRIEYIGQEEFEHQQIQKIRKNNYHY